MKREPYLPPKKSVDERIEELQKERAEIDDKIRTLEVIKRESLKEVTPKSYSYSNEKWKTRLNTIY